MESGWGPEVLAKHIKGFVLQPQYWLASEEGCCFPAAVQDGLTAYYYVLNTLGVSPEQVILSGESAGGNLVLAMLRYLHGGGKGTMPLPRAALLWSPWLDLTAEKERIDGHANAKTDYVTGDLVEWGVERYTPPDWDKGNPYISPLGNEFESKVPIFLQTGTAEVLYDDHVQFTRSMRAKGTRLDLLEIENAPHDTFGAGIIFGFAKEAEDAAEKAAVFSEEVGEKRNVRMEL
jgi:acetyl esterase/lipase